MSHIKTGISNSSNKIGWKKTLVWRGMTLLAGVVGAFSRSIPTNQTYLNQVTRVDLLSNNSNQSKYPIDWEVNPLGNIAGAKISDTEQDPPINISKAKENGRRLLNLFNTKTSMQVSESGSLRKRLLDKIKRWIWTK